MAKATFKDWKNTGGVKAMEKEIKATIAKNRNKYMLLSLIPFIGPFAFGAQAVICMDTLRDLENKRGNGFGASILRLWIRLGSCFISFIIEHIIASSETKVQKVCGVYDMLNN